MNFILVLSTFDIIGLIIICNIMYLIKLQKFSNFKNLVFYFLLSVIFIIGDQRQLVVKKIFSKIYCDS